MERDLSATPFQLAASLSCYNLGFALIPLLSSSFSEEFGRRPLYIISALVFFLMHIAVAL
jgi:MFS family permease